MITKRKFILISLILRTFLAVSSLHGAKSVHGSFTPLDPDAQAGDVLYGVFMNTATGKLVGTDGKKLKGNLEGTMPLRKKNLKRSAAKGLRNFVAGKPLKEDEERTFTAIREAIEFVSDMQDVLVPLKGETSTPPTKLEIATFLLSVSAESLVKLTNPIDIVKTRLLAKNNAAFSKAIMTELMKKVKNRAMSSVIEGAKGQLTTGADATKVSKSITRSTTALNILDRIATGEAKWTDKAVLGTAEGSLKFAEWMRGKLKKKKENLRERRASSVVVDVLLENKALIAGVVGEAAEGAAREVFGNRPVDAIKDGVEIGKKLAGYGLDAVKTTASKVTEGFQLVSTVIEHREEIANQAVTTAQETIDTLKGALDPKKPVVWVVQRAKDATGEVVSNVVSFTADTAAQARQLAESAAAKGTAAYQSAMESGKGALVAMGEAGRQAATTVGDLAAAGAGYVKEASSEALGSLAAMPDKVANIGKATLSTLASGLGLLSDEPSAAAPAAPLPPAEQEQLDTAFAASGTYEEFAETAEKILNNNESQAEAALMAVGQESAKREILPTLTPTDLAGMTAPDVKDFVENLSVDELALMEPKSLTALEGEVAGDPTLKAKVKKAVTFEPDKTKLIATLNTLKGPAKEEQFIDWITTLSTKEREAIQQEIQDAIVQNSFEATLADMQSKPAFSGQELLTFQAQLLNLEEMPQYATNTDLIKSLASVNTQLKDKLFSFLATEPDSKTALKGILNPTDPEHLSIEEEIYKNLSAPERQKIAQTVGENDPYAVNDNAGKQDPTPTPETPEDKVKAQIAAATDLDALTKIVDDAKTENIDVETDTTLKAALDAQVLKIVTEQLNKAVTPDDVGTIANDIDESKLDIDLERGSPVYDALTARETQIKTEIQQRGSATPRASTTSGSSLDPNKVDPTTKGNTSTTTGGNTKQNPHDRVNPYTQWTVIDGPPSPIPGADATDEERQEYQNDLDAWHTYQQQQQAEQKKKPRRDSGIEDDHPGDEHGIEAGGER